MGVYTYIGASSTASDAHHAQGALRLRDDLRHAGGLLAAPLGIMVLDCAASNTQHLALSAPVRVDVHVVDVAAGVERLAIDGAVVRHGRTLLCTEARIADADAPDRLVGYATTTFAATGPPRTSAQYAHTAPADDGPTTGWPPLAAAFGGARTDAARWEIGALDPERGPRRLHSGVMMTVAEAACLELVAEQVGAAPWRTTLLGTAVMTEGRAGPFVVLPEVLAGDGPTATCRVEVRDTGADDRFVALLTLRLDRPG
jgi:hypothetical protein